MSKKRVDIDELLGQDQLELKVGDKIYEVKDVPLDVFLEISSMPDNMEEGEQNLKIMHTQLAQLLGTEFDDVKHLGFRAAALCIKEITQWVYGQAEDIGGSGPTGSNP